MREKELADMRERMIRETEDFLSRHLTGREVDGGMPLTCRPARAGNGRGAATVAALAARIGEKSAGLVTDR